MNKIIVTTDSSSDLPEEYKLKKSLKIIQIPVILGGEEYVGNDNNVLFNYVKDTKELPKTAAPSVENYNEFFAQTCENAEHVIHISLSSNLSSACQNAIIASKKYPKVTVIDSKNLSSGIGLQVMACIDDIENGLAFDEVIKRARERSSMVRTSFIIDSLLYLKKSGRCSTLALLGANLLKIKPQIVVENGGMHTGKKYRGRLDAVLYDYTHYILEKKDTFDLTRAFVTYTSADDAIVENIKNKLREVGFKEVYNVTASGTISCHCGPLTLGILYIENKG